MLLRFEVANHRSILDPIELSMIAVDVDRPAARSFELLPEKVLTVAGIYGPNASGKSNVLEALAWLSTAVGSSLRSWGNTIPRDPFKFRNGPGQPSTYEVEMMSNNVRYAYRLEVTDSEVLSEGLVSYPKRQPRTLFEREGMEINFRRGLGNTIGTRELLTPTTLALSAVLRFDEPEISPFGRDISLIRELGISHRRTWRGILPSPLQTATIFRDESESNIPEGMRDSALAMLRFADLGIEEVQTVPYTEFTRRNEAVERRKLVLLHRSEDQEILFDLNDESAGTQTWFRLIGPALNALRHGRILLFDEIDASLHPRLSAHLIEIFQDPVANPHGAQLIFTTHDTSLLNYLNRDEVWLTEKDKSAATTLTALAEFGGNKVRQSLNLERAYLQGRFGAVPELDQVALRRALGLAAGNQS
jgi:predicted ATPase